MLSNLMALFYFAFYVLRVAEIFGTFLLVETWWYFICGQIKANMAHTAVKILYCGIMVWAARFLPLPQTFFF